MLFTIMTVMSRFLRAAWIRWLRPIPTRSPSPPKTTTFSVGRTSFTPVAAGMLLPWVVWMESALKYGDGIQAAHPIPLQNTNLRRSL